jgi:hypothetical protein
MLLPAIPELQLVGVYDRGKANLERIALRAHATIDVVQYALLAGTVAITPEARFIYPARDLLFYFGAGVVKAGEWILVYTGPGEGLTTTMTNTDETVYVVHWGRPNTIFADSRISAALVRLDAIEVVPPPINEPQQPQLITPGTAVR